MPTEVTALKKVRFDSLNLFYYRVQVEMFEKEDIFNSIVFQVLSLVQCYCHGNGF